MPPILAVTPNPSIDKTAIVPGYRLGAIHRPQRQLALAGGKGLNVARTIQRLEAEARACLLLSGHTGRWLVDELEREGISASVVWGKGETRTCLSILDPETGAMTEYYEPGSAVNDSTWNAFEAAAVGEMAQADMVVLSGSLPPGGPIEGYARLAVAARVRGLPVLLDAQGEALRLALGAQPHLVKLNASEAADLLGRPVTNVSEAAEAARELHGHSVANAVVTLGAAGAVAANAEGGWHVAAPPVEALSAVGSGDTLLGGLAVGLQWGLPLPNALALAVAAAAANTLQLGAGVFDPNQAAELVPQTEVYAL